MLDFHGDIRASAVASLREEISAVLMAAGPGDEVLLRLESPGGMVNAYGLAASQLLRLREKGIPLTVAVDKVAASGGYLMAVVADRIIAAPFAVLGSIGVVAQIPNFHRWLRDRRIDFELFTAGEFKRTVTVFGENTEQGREKLREEIADTHQLFQDFVKRFRPQLDMARVATGEPWYGTHAMEMGLVDALATSDSYLMDAAQRARIYAVSYKRKKTLGGKLFGTASNLAAQFTPPRH